MWGKGFPLSQDFPKPDMSESGDKNDQGMQRCEVQRSGKDQKESDAHAFRLPSRIAPARNLSFPTCEMGEVFTIVSGGCPWQRWSRENRILAFRDGAGGEQREDLLQAKVVLEESTISGTPEPPEHLFLQAVHMPPKDPESFPYLVSDRKGSWEETPVWVAFRRQGCLGSV